MESEAMHGPGHDLDIHGFNLRRTLRLLFLINWFFFFFFIYLYKLVVLGINIINTLFIVSIVLSTINGIINWVVGKSPERDETLYEELFLTLIKKLSKNL